MYVKRKVDLDRKTETFYGQVIERVESKRISAHQVLEICVIKFTSPFSHLFYVRPLCLIMQMQRPHLSSLHTPLVMKATVMACFLSVPSLPLFRENCSVLQLLYMGLSDDCVRANTTIYFV